MSPAPMVCKLIFMRTFIIRPIQEVVHAASANRTNSIGWSGRFFHTYQIQKYQIPMAINGITRSRCVFSWTDSRNPKAFKSPTVTSGKKVYKVNACPRIIQRCAGRNPKNKVDVSLKRRKATKITGWNTGWKISEIPLANKFPTEGLIVADIRAGKVGNQRISTLF